MRRRPPSPALPIASTRLARSLTLLGVLLALLYWLADGLLDALVFHDGHLRGQLLPAGSDLRDRIMVVALLVLGGICGQRLLTRAARTEADAARRSQERRFRMLVEKGADAVILADRESRILFASPATVQLVGYAPGEVVGTLGLGFVHPDDTPGNHVHRETRAIPGASRTTECRVRHKDGTWRWVEMTSTNRLDEPEIGAIVYNLRDITARKAAEEGLRTSEARYRTLIERSPEPIIVHRAGRFLFVNEAAVRLHRAESDADFLERPVFDFIPQEFHAFAEQRLDVAYRERQPLGPFDIAIRRVDGTLAAVELRSLPIVFDGAEATLSVLHDVTERTALTAELRQAKDAAEVAYRAKADFLATMSHELRTPLNGVLGFCEVLRETALDDEQREYLETVATSGETLLRIIGNILDFCRLEARNLALETFDFDVSATVAEVAAVLGAQAEAKGIALRTAIAPTVPTALRGDPFRLRQVLTNLIDNAVKFTERGDVAVAVTCAEERGESVVVAFAVTDTGIGLTAAEQEHLFEPFTQADSTATRAHGGIGLGLAVTKQLVELMGGTVVAESTAGAGSTFRFTARFAKQPAVPPPVESSDAPTAGETGERLSPRSVAIAD
jgi:two-component system sensor histidine kinase/response regulator